MPITPPENAEYKNTDDYNYIEGTAYEFIASNDAGQIDKPAVKFGATSNEVFYNGDSVITGIPKYTLTQLFEAFVDFLKTNHYVYMGETQPINPNTKIWIDTSETNESLWNNED